MIPQFVASKLTLKIRNRVHWGNLASHSEVKIGILEFLSFLNLNYKPKLIHQSQFNFDTILYNVSFTLNKGEILGIMDSSSYCRHTLCKVLGGKLSANSGEIEYLGTRAYFSQIFANTSIYKSLEYNLINYARLIGISQEGTNRALELIRKNNLFTSCLKVSLKRLPKDLISTVWFCFIIELQVDILVMDDSFEPSTEELKSTCFNKFQDAINRKMTIIMGVSTKNTYKKFFTKILLLNNGKPIIIDTPQIVKEKHPTLFNLANKKSNYDTDFLELNYDEEDNELDMFEDEIENNSDYKSSEMSPSDQEENIYFNDKIELLHGQKTNELANLSFNNISFSKNEVQMSKPNIDEKLKIIFHFTSDSYERKYEAYVELRKKKKICIATFGSNNITKLETEGRYKVEIIIPSDVLRTGIFQLFPVVKSTSINKRTGKEIEKTFTSPFYVDLIPLSSDQDKAQNDFIEYKKNTPNLPSININTEYELRLPESFNLLVDTKNRQPIAISEKSTIQNNIGCKISFLIHSQYLLTKPDMYILVETKNGTTMSLKIKPKSNNFSVNSEFYEVNIELNHIIVKNLFLKVIEIKSNYAVYKISKPIEIFGIDNHQIQPHSSNSEHFSLHFNGS